MKKTRLLVALMSIIAVSFTLMAQTTVYIDCGSATGATGWNNLNITVSSATAVLIGTNGVNTGISVTVSNRMTAVTTGVSSGSFTGDALEFIDSGNNGAFGSTNVWTTEPACPRGDLVFSGLNTNVAYTFTYFASRNNDSTGWNREGQYTLTGDSTVTNYLDAADNFSEVAVSSPVYPDASGTILLTVQPGPNNTVPGSNYFYLNAFKMEYDDGTVYTNNAKKLLFFGNSFSLGAEGGPNISILVRDLAVIAGYDEPLVVADLMGGQDLAYHITQVETNSGSNVDSASLPSGETWDNVIMQGYSTEATHLRDPMVFKTNAVTLFQLIKNHSSGKGAGVEGILYETWARAPGHSVYPDEFDDPAAMQLEIRTNYNGAAEMITAAEGAGSVRVAGVGDAFETGEFDLDLYLSELYHQSTLGARLGAMVIFKTIYNHDATNLSYSAAVAAGWTSMSATEWTNLTFWADGVSTAATNNLPVNPVQQGGSSNVTEVIYIDPAPNTGDPSLTNADWNCISFYSAGATIDLISTNDTDTEIKATVITRLNSINTAGSTDPTGDAAEFKPAGGNSAYGNDTDWGGVYPLGEVRFEGLNTTVAYTFTMYASRLGGDIREAEYIFAGAQTNSVLLDASYNSTEVVIASNVYADVNGVINFSMVSGPNNTESHGFFYLSAMKIEYVPAELTLSGTMYVDVAGSNSGVNWNQIAANVAGSRASLIRTDGDVSGYKIAVQTAVAGTGNYSTPTPTGDAAEFQPAGSYGVHGDSGHTRGVMKLSNLNPDHLYDFTFFASRVSVTSNRETLYTVTGENSDSATLNPSSNTSNVCVVAGIKPDALGEIEITFEKGPNHGTADSYFYMTAFKISDYEILGTVPPVIPAGAKRLLFLVDQFTADQDVPGLVKDLAVAAGQEEPLVVVELEPDMVMADYVGRVANYAPCNVDSFRLPDGDSWDHVIVQGGSSESSALGDSLSFKNNAVTLYQLIKNHGSGKGAGSEMLLLETWAAEERNAWYPGTFADPATMQLDIRTNYTAAVDMVNAAEGAGSARVAAVGDAFETGEFYYALYDKNDLFTESEIGARLAAMVLYKQIYNEDATNLSYAAAVAAGWTTMNEFDWDRLALWADGVASPLGEPGQTETIYIDAYGTGEPTTWNSGNFGSTASDMELRNVFAQLTGIYMDVTDSIYVHDTNGSTATGDAVEFAPAGRSEAYGSNNSPTNTIVFSGMKPGRSYEFTFYSSRNLVAGENRDTLFTLTGSSQVSDHIDSNGNNSEVVKLNLNPASDGSIVLDITKGPDNDNTSGYFYITAIKIKSTGSGSVIILQ